MKRRPWKRIVFVIVLTAVLITSGWIAFDYTRRPRIITGPMVQMLSTTGFTLVWQTHPSKAATVNLKRSDGSSVGTFSAQCECNRHLAVITGLEPGTEYLYQITFEANSGRHLLVAENTVRTAPATGEPFRFLAFGDSGAGSAAQNRLARHMLQYDPDLIIHTGDLIYPEGAGEDFAAKFYRPYAHLIDHVSFYPCMGNHDVMTQQGRPFLNNFILPENGPAETQPEQHYWFDYSNARFVAIDSNHDYSHFHNIVAPWLDKVLADAGDRWKIVFFHEPTYTHGKYEPAEKLLKSIIPVIDRHQVDLVLSGHNHMYERSYPLRDGRVTPDGAGTIYIVTGAGGAKLYEARYPPPDFLASWCDWQHSFTVIDVSPEMLAIRQIGIDGKVIDEYYVARSGSSGS